MSKLQSFSSIRISPRDSEFLDRRMGARGEIFYDQTTGTLRLYNSQTQGGISLAKIDLSNVSNAVFSAKAAAALTAVATSGDYDDLINRPTIPTLVSQLSNDSGFLTSIGTISYNDLSDKPAPPDLPETYEFSVAADDSTQRVIDSGETIKFIGSGGITTSSDSEGNITITAAQTLTNKRIDPRSVNASATSGAITPDGDITDIYVATGLTGGITINTPSGTPVNGQKLLIRLRDDGTGRSITWTSTSGAFRAVGIILPTTTVANKTSYVGCVYNSADSFWDAIAVVTEV